MRHSEVMVRTTHEEFVVSQRADEITNSNKIISNFYRIFIFINTMRKIISNV